MREEREGEEGRYTDHLCTQDAALPGEREAGRAGVREEGEEGRYTDHLCTQDAALPGEREAGRETR